MGLGPELSVMDRARIVELHNIGWDYKRITKSILNGVFYRYDTRFERR
jgi:hypothetical protein